MTNSITYDMFQMQPGLTNNAFLYAFTIYLYVKPPAPHNTVASLVVKIKEVMGNFDRDTVMWACR